MTGAWDDLKRNALAADIAAVAPAGLKREGYQLVGPCVSCGGTDRFWIDLRRSRKRWGCRGCHKESGDVIDLVMFVHGCDFKAAVEMLAGDTVPVRAAPEPEPANDDETKRRTAAMLWSQRRRPIAGTIGEIYLREVRKIRCRLPPTLGFLPAYKDHPPAIIAAVAFAHEAAPGILAAPVNVDAVHLTRLQEDGGGKAEVESPKGYLASPGDRPIVIAPPNDLLGMAITEGIEDGLSAFEATGLGIWAAGTANRMEKIAARVPRWIECVTIFAHGDDNGAGRDNAMDAADVLYDRGIEVRIEGLSP
jgi:putative DNA primase/helicase